MKMSPGCNCCGPPPACGQVCVGVTDTCTNAPSIGATVTVKSSSVTSLTLGSGGSGYTNGTNKSLTFTGGGGSGAAGLYDVVGGVIGNLRLTNGGGNFTSAPTVGFSGSGAGTGASATANVTLNYTHGTCTTDGQVTGLTVTNPTVNGPYTSTPPSVTISGGGGSGATATAVVTGGALNTPFTTANGSGYTSRPTISFTGGGTGGTGTATMGVRAVTITNAGSGGTAGSYAMTISGGGGSGAAGTYTIGSGGTITATNVTSSGSGYTSLPSVSFPSGGIVGAAGAPDLKVNSWSLGAGGQFYVSPTVVFSGGGGSGAAGGVSASAIRVTSLTLTNNGTGYTSTPTVTIAPPASGTTATATAQWAARCCVSIPQPGIYNTSGTRTNYTTGTTNINSTCTTNSTGVSITPVANTQDHQVLVTVTGCGSQPLPNASVVATKGGASVSGTTDSSGQVTLDLGTNSDGTWTITASKARFANGTGSVTFGVCPTLTPTLLSTINLTPATGYHCFINQWGCSLDSTITGYNPFPDPVPNTLYLTDANGTHTITNLNGQNGCYEFTYTGNSYQNSGSSGYCSGGTLPTPNCRQAVSFTFGWRQISGVDYFTLCTQAAGCNDLSPPNALDHAFGICGSNTGGYDIVYAATGCTGPSTIYGAAGIDTPTTAITSHTVPISTTFTLAAQFMIDLLGSTVSLSE